MENKGRVFFPSIFIGMTPKPQTNLTRLYNAYVRASSYEPGKRDEVRVRVTEMKNVQMTPKIPVEPCSHLLATLQAMRS